ncbi:MAG: lipid-A-disaccharide synthase [Candidatus Omnitrophota bacterium]|nr:MAG: lipid-A-disaccharide synthase [Candidatus Omnitrophota bacterium]
MAQKHILIICGEASGDLNASYLIQAIKSLMPEVKFSGIGGIYMQQQGVKLYDHIQKLSVLGFFDALKKLTRFIHLKKLILKKIREEKPDAIILVDFSGFNLRLAKEIKKSIPVIYYISPQVWASRPGRIKTIKKYVNEMIVLFGFEEEFYKKHGVNANCVGHPLLDTVRISMDEKEFLTKLHLSESKIIIALLPGSRTQEVKYILPVMLKAAKHIQRKIKDVQFVVAKSPNVGINIYKKNILGSGIDVKFIDNKTYECLNIAKFCLVASGTATIETAIAGKPFLIIYKMGWLNYLLYRPQIKLPFIGMVNLIARKKIIPEFIQSKAKPKKIAQETIRILGDSSEIKRIQSDLAEVKSLLGDEGANARAASLIIDFLSKK